MQKRKKEKKKRTEKARKHHCRKQAKDNTPGRCVRAAFEQAQHISMYTMRLRKRPEIAPAKAGGHRGWSTQVSAARPLRKSTSQDVLWPHVKDCRHGLSQEFLGAVPDSTGLPPPPHNGYEMLLAPCQLSPLSQHLRTACAWRGSSSGTEIPSSRNWDSLVILGEKNSTEYCPGWGRRGRAETSSVDNLSTHTCTPHTHTMHTRKLSARRRLTIYAHLGTS